MADLTRGPFREEEYLVLLERYFELRQVVRGDVDIDPNLFKDHLANLSEEIGRARLAIETQYRSISGILLNEGKPYIDRFKPTPVPNRALIEIYEVWRRNISESTDNESEESANVSRDSSNDSKPVDSIYDSAAMAQDPDDVTVVRNEWRTAAANVGIGTPTGKLLLDIEGAVGQPGIQTWISGVDAVSIAPAMVRGRLTQFVSVLIFIRSGLVFAPILFFWFALQGALEDCKSRDESSKPFFDCWNSDVGDLAGDTLIVIFLVTTIIFINLLVTFLRGIEDGRLERSGQAIQALLARTIALSVNRQTESPEEQVVEFTKVGLGLTKELSGLAEVLKKQAAPIEGSLLALDESMRLVAGTVQSQRDLFESSINNQRDLFESSINKMSEMIQQQSVQLSEVTEGLSQVTNVATQLEEIGVSIGRTAVDFEKISEGLKPAFDNLKETSSQMEGTGTSMQRAVDNMAQTMIEIGNYTGELQEMSKNFNELVNRFLDVRPQS